MKNIKIELSIFNSDMYKLLADQSGETIDVFVNKVLLESIDIAKRLLRESENNSNYDVGMDLNELMKHMRKSPIGKMVVQNYNDIND